MDGLPGLTGGRRLYPRPWDYCAYNLRCLRVVLKRLAKAELSPKPNAVVVDFGCGERPYEPLFKEFGSKYIGVDILGNETADVQFEPGSPIPLEDESADLVLSNQVLEHVVDVPEYLAECHRVLKQGGLLILSTHGSWTYHPYPVDVRRWTSWGLRHDIECSGLRVESIDGCMGPLAYTTQLRLQLIRGALWKLGRVGQPLIHAISWYSQLLMWCEDKITPRAISQSNAAIYVVAARKPADAV